MIDKHCEDKMGCSETSRLRKYEGIRLCPSCAIRNGFEPTVSCINCKDGCIDKDKGATYCQEECLCYGCRFTYFRKDCYLNELSNGDDMFLGD